MSPTPITDSERMQAIRELNIRIRSTEQILQQLRQQRDAQLATAEGAATAAIMLDGERIGVPEFDASLASMQLDRLEAEMELSASHLSGVIHDYREARSQIATTRISPKQQQQDLQRSMARSIANDETLHGSNWAK